MSARKFMLTGATGVLGSWVLARALERGYRPVVLMRDVSESSARSRLRAVLQLAGCPGGERDVDVMLGDATSVGFGVDAARLRTVEHGLDGLVHCAACTSFAPSRGAEVMSTNVGAVREVLQFVSERRLPLYHVSTAYVAGKRTGCVAENELEHDAGFNNTYEQSKYESERLISEAMASGRVTGAVLRPSIIVGDSVSGRICQFAHFYNFLRVLHGAARSVRSNKAPFRLAANPDCTKNLVPVDWAAEAIWRIIESDGPAGCRYHLTNPFPPSTAFIINWINEQFGEHGVEIQLTRSNGHAAVMDKQMRRASMHLEGYLEDEPVFDTTNTDRAIDGALPFPRLDKTFLSKLYQYAKSERWRGILANGTPSDPVREALSPRNADAEAKFMGVA